MNGRFDSCVRFVLQHETEYNDDGTVKVERDPSDPGGTTKFGIDQRDHPNVNVAELTLDQAKEIYRAGEWTGCRCENLKMGFDLAVFDSAVNIGTGRAARLLQQAVGAKVDGFIGPKTIAAVNGASLDALGRFIDLRQVYYESLPKKLKERFLHGWLNRVADLRATVGLTGKTNLAAALPV
jgi:lysozyme family protein